MALSKKCDKLRAATFLKYAKPPGLIVDCTVYSFDSELYKLSCILISVFQLVPYLIFVTNATNVFCANFSIECKKNPNECKQKCF